MWPVNEEERNVLTVPLAIIMVLAYVFTADTRSAKRVAREQCPGTQVERVDGQLRYECEGRHYAVRCDGGECTVDPL